MRILVYGCNRLVSRLIPDLVGEGVEIAVLGNEKDCLKGLASQAGVQVILTAEPMMQDYLQEAGISHADVFLAMSTDDYENVLTAQIAQQIFNVPKVVCHLINPQLQVLYSTLGLNIVGYTAGLIHDVRQAIQR